MSKSELIVGLDIGTTKICAVVGEPSENGGMDIVGIGTSPSTGLRKGVVVNIEQTVQSIKRALEEAELMAGCEIRSVYAGIAGSHIKGFNSHGVIAVKGGEVSPRDIERALDAAKAVAIPLDREVIHILPQEYIVDDQRGIADPMGMAGVRLEVKVHIVTGAVTSAQNIVRSCHKSGLDVSDIVLESLASAKAVLTEEEREIGVALIDLGGGTCDIAIFANDSIKHTGVLALGGQKRFAYEEIVFTCQEMENGVSEQEAYQRMGMRMGTGAYRSLAVLLTQNLKKGSKGLLELLKQESQEAFEERRRQAKTTGEKASTKLLLPMGMMLAVVLVILTVPAFLSFYA